MKSYTFTVLFEPSEEGGYTATVPALPGCISEGKDLDEAKQNIKEAIELHLESMLEDGETIPDEGVVEVIKDKVTISLEAA